MSRYFWMRLRPDALNPYTTATSFVSGSYRIAARIPDSDTTRALDDLVEHLLDQWENETCHVSSPSIAMSHPAFKRLVALGDEAIEPLIRLYRTRDGFAFMVLSSITGINPVAPKQQGNLYAAKQAWMKWWANTNAPVQPSTLFLHFPTTHTHELARYQPVFG